MKDDKSRWFNYIQIPNEGKRYFCLEQSLVVLAWILYFHHDVLSPIDRTAQKALSFTFLINRIRNFVGLLKKNAKALFVFALYKYQWRRVECVVELAQYGQLCLPVHHGYKLFDLWRNVTIKVFDSDVPGSVFLDEIELLKRTSKLDFAPVLRRWNLGDRWYEEDFLFGSVDSTNEPIDSVTLLTKFQNEVIQYLNRLVLFQEIATRNSIEYVDEILLHAGLHEVSKNEVIARDLEPIIIFLNMMTGKLMKEEGCSIDLVFSHGDFVPANMLNARQGMKIIDWESSGLRSTLFDFYSYFFYRPGSRKVPVQTVLLEINQALPMFLSSLSKSSMEISRNAEQFKKVYRWVFYIEILCRLIERENSDRNLNIRQYILRYIDVFKKFEDLAKSNG